MAFLPLFPFIFPTASALAASDFETIGEVTRLGYYVVMIVMALLAPFARYNAAVVNTIWRFVAAVQYMSWLAAAEISASEALVRFWAGFGVPCSPWLNLFPRHHISLGNTVLRSPLFLHNAFYLLLTLAFSGLLHALSRLCKQRNSALWQYCFQYDAQLMALALGCLLAFQDLLIFALVQGQNMHFSSYFAGISAVTGFIYIPLAVSAILYLFYLFVTARSAIVNGRVTDKSTVLALFVDGMNTKLPILYYCAVPVFTLQRLFASFLYVFFTSNGKLQVSVLFLLEFLVLCYYALTRPYQLRRNNAFSLSLQVIPCIMVLVMCTMEAKVTAKSQELLTFTYISLFCSVFPISVSQFLLEFWSATRVAPISPLPESWGHTELFSQPSHSDFHIESQLPNDPYLYMSAWVTRQKLKKLAKIAPSPTSESQRIKGDEGKIPFRGLR